MNVAMFHWKRGNSNDPEYLGIICSQEGHECCFLSNTSYSGRHGSVEETGPNEYTVRFHCFGQRALDNHPAWAFLEKDPESNRLRGFDHKSRPIIATGVASFKVYDDGMLEEAMRMLADEHKATQIRDGDRR